MKTITKTFKTLEEATQYQDELYGQYDYVRLVKFPRFDESGVYVWEVKDDSPTSSQPVCQGNTDAKFPLIAQ